MKKYTNKTSTMKVVEFEDGTAQFLARGQSFTTDKAVKKVQEGLTETKVVIKKQAPKTNKQLPVKTNKQPPVKTKKDDKGEE